MKHLSDSSASNSACGPLGKQLLLCTTLFYAACLGECFALHIMAHEKRTTPLDLCPSPHSHGLVPSVNTVIQSLISPTIPYTPARKTHVYFLSTVFVASIGVRQVKLVANFDHRSLAFHIFLQSLIVKRFSVFFFFFLFPRGRCNSTGFEMFLGFLPVGN